MSTKTYVVLSDVTPNRGTIEAIGDEEIERQHDNQLICTWIGEKEPLIGKRVYRDGYQAW